MGAGEKAMTEEELLSKIERVFVNAALRRGFELGRKSWEESVLKQRRTKEKIFARQRVDRAYRELKVVK